MNEWLPVLITGVLSLLASFLVARLSRQAQDAKTKVEQDQSSGRLAYDIARDLRVELQDHERQIAEQRSYIEILSALLRAAGIQVPPEIH